MNLRRRAIKQTMYRDKYPHCGEVEFGVTMTGILKHLMAPKRANQISWHKSNRSWR